MNVNILLSLLFIVLLCSCKSREYIEFRHRNYMKIYNDEVVIKIIPLKNKDSVLVKASYNEQLVNVNSEKLEIRHLTKSTKNYITNEYYNMIVGLINKIKKEDLKDSRSEKDSVTGLNSLRFIGVDAGSNKIIYRNRSFSKEYSARGISDLYKNFYEATMLIFKAAKLPVKSNL